MVQPQAPFANLSREQMGLVIRNKKQFYKAMLQAGWVLPAEKQTIMSIKFMHLVRGRQVMMPRAEDGPVNHVVAYPPTNKMIVELIAEAAETLPERESYDDEMMAPVRRLVKILQKKSADKAWLLRVLHHLDSGHPVFAKDYRYVRPANKLNPDRLEVFHNDDGFYDDLPPLQPHELRGRQMRLAKGDKQTLQMKMYEARQQDLKERMDRLKREMAEEQKKQAEEQKAADSDEAEVHPVQAAMNNARVGAPMEEEK